MTDLFDGTLHLEASPKLAKKLEKALSKSTSKLEGVLPAFTPTTVPIWGREEQEKALRKYIHYLYGAANRAKWPELARLLEAISHIQLAELRHAQAVAADIAALNCGVLNPNSQDAAKADLASAIINARKVLGKMMSQFWHNPGKAALAEPLFMLLLAEVRTLGFLACKLELYKGLGTQYPTFWGPNPHLPRWVRGLGIREKANHWRAIAPLSPTQAERAFRSPLKRALQPNGRPTPKVWAQAASLAAPPLTGTGLVTSKPSPTFNLVKQP